MNDLDFNDKQFNYRETRSAPVKKSGQPEYRKKKTTYRRARFRDIEQRREDLRLEEELREIYDW